MVRLRNLVLVLLLGLAGYAALFAFVVKRPLTVGFIHDAYEAKAAYAARIHRPKIVILAGSNGLISHRCETIEREMGRPCLNASITAELGLAYTLELGQRFLGRGDVVLMPLEYGLYGVPRDAAEREKRHPYIFSYDRSLMAGLSPTEMAAAALQFDLKYLIGGILEMGLDAAGVRRRYSRDRLTPQGDFSGHDATEAATFRASIAAEKFWLKPSAEFPITKAARETLTAFLTWAKRHEITVIGTLPTTFDDRPVEQALIDRLASLYHDAGQAFLVLPNRSQYPRDCFYDTQYHLRQECQIRHSRALAKALGAFLAREDRVR